MSAHELLRFTPFFFLQWYLHPSFDLASKLQWPLDSAVSLRLRPSGLHAKGAKVLRSPFVPLGESDGWIHRIWKHPALRWPTLLSCCFGCVDQNPLWHNIDKEKKKGQAFKDVWIGWGFFIGGRLGCSPVFFFHSMVGLLSPLGSCVGKCVARRFVRRSNRGFEELNDCFFGKTRGLPYS